MSDLPVARPAPVATGDIDPGRSCARCGYDLRGLPADALCPECATPVARSLQGRLLRFADPCWLSALRNGAALLLLHVMLRMTAGVLTSLTAFGGQWLVYLIWLIGDGLGVLAVFLLTTSEPASPARDESTTLRRVLRIACVIGLFSRYAWVLPVLSARVPQAAGGVISAGANLLLVIGLLLYLRRLAVRVPDTVLVSNTVIVTFGLGAIMGGSVFLHATMLLLGPQGLSRIASEPAFSVLFAVASGGGLVFGIWFVIVLLHYVSAFRRAAGQASELQIE